MEHSPSETSVCGRALIFGVGLLYAWWTTLNSTLVLCYTGQRGMGLYALVLVAGGTLDLLPGAVAQILYPRMAEDYGRTGDRRRLLHIAVKPIALTALGMIPIIAVSWWLVAPAMRLLLPNYVEAVPAMRWALLFPFVDSFTSLHLIFNVVRRQGLYAVSIVTGMAAYVGCLLWLVRNGATLVAFPQAMLVGQTIFVIGCYFMVFYLMEGRPEKRSASTRFSVEVIRDIEAKLSEPLFRGVPIGSTLNEVYVMKLYLGHGHWSIVSGFMDRLRRAKHSLRPKMASRPMPLMPQGRILVTWMEDTPRISALIQPVLAEIESEKPLVLCGTSDLRGKAADPDRTITWDQVVHYDVAAWRADYRKCCGPWKQSLRELCRRHKLPRGIYDYLALHLLVSSHASPVASSFCRRFAHRRFLPNMIGTACGRCWCCRPGGLGFLRLRWFMAC